MPVVISGTDGITSPTITTTSTIVSGTTVADATAVIRPLVSATAVATTSGTSKDFTSIPSWVKRITLMFNGVSTNGSSNLLVQVGSGSVSTTGYAASGGYYGAGSYAVLNVTTGFIIYAGAAAVSRSGIMTICLLSGTSWVSSHSAVTVTGDILAYNGGGVSPSLSGALDIVRITTANGTDAFDAGSINILYE